MKQLIFALMFVALVVFVIGCTAPVEPLENEPFVLESTAPSSPISVKLIVSPFSEPLGLESHTNLIMGVSLHPSYSWNAPNTTAEIVLPEGIALVSGDATWNADLTPGDSVNLSIIVKASKVGDWTVTAFAKSYIDTDSWYGDAVYICFLVSEDQVKIQRDRCPEKTKLPPGVRETETEPPGRIVPPGPSCPAGYEWNSELQKCDATPGPSEPPEGDVIPPEPSEPPTTS